MASIVLTNLVFVLFGNVKLLWAPSEGSSCTSRTAGFFPSSAPSSFRPLLFASAARPGRPSLPEDAKTGQEYSSLTTPTKKKQGYIDQRGGTYSADVTAPDGTPLSPATATKQIAYAKNAHAIDKRAATKKAKAR